MFRLKCVRTDKEKFELVSCFGRGRCNNFKRVPWFAGKFKENIKRNISTNQPQNIGTIGNGNIPTKHPLFCKN